MTATKTYDVGIIGGGPAGLKAAELLAAAGHSVIVLEEHSTVGEPMHCTGLLGIEAYDDFDLPKEAILRSHSSVRFYSPGGKMFYYASEAPQAYVVDRDRFDQGLLRLAAERGAVVETGIRVTDIVIGSDRVVLKTARTGKEYKDCPDEGATVAKVCLLASGAGYQLHRGLGLAPPPVFIQTAQIEVDFEASDDVEVHLGNGPSRGCFAWVVPFSRNGISRARLGVLTDEGADQYLERFAGKTENVRRITKDAKHFHFRRRPIPLLPVKKSYCDRLLVIGDAAGLVKPTTGGGIYYSLLSAEMACETIIEAFSRGDFSEITLRNYERQWRRGLLPEIKVGMRFRSLASRFTDTQVEELFTYALADGFPDLIRKKASFNWHRQLILALLKRPPFLKALMQTVALGR